MDQSTTQYISTLELAKFLGLTPVAIFHRIKKGHIKAVKVGRSYAISLSYVREHFPGFHSPHLLEGEYLSIMQVAAELGVSRITIFKRVKNGELPARKVGRHYVIARDHVIKKVQGEPQAVSLSQQEYFSVPQLAAILGVSRIAVFKNIQRGMIKAKKVGRNYAIARADAGFVQTDSATAPTTVEATTHISVPELARRMGISRIAVFKKIQKGILKAVKVGRSYAIDEKDLDTTN